MSLKNESGGTVWIKPENGATAISIGPGNTYGSQVDGVCVPATHPKKVFKIVDDCDGQVTSSGNVETDCSLISAPVQAISGGWKDEAWLRSLQSRGDHGWDDIFLRSGLN